MKKTTKKLLTVLCASCMAASVGAFTACNTDLSDVKDPALFALYEQSNSQLSYEEWLKKEFNGKSITSIALSEDGSSYVITYSDGSTENLSATQPKEEEKHVHSFGEEISVVSEPEGATDGFGYKTCACGEKNFVLLKNYILSVEEEGIYYYNFNLIEKDDSLTGYENKIKITNTTNKVIKYTVTALNENASFGEEGATSYSVILQAGKSENVDYVLDSSKVNTAGKYLTQFAVSCEEVELGSKDNPIYISFKEVVNYKAPKDKEVYFCLDFVGGSNLDLFEGEVTTVSFKFADTVSLEYENYYYVDWAEDSDNKTLYYQEKDIKDITSGARIDLANPGSYAYVGRSIIKATSTDGNIAFVTANPVGDSEDKPVEIQLNKVYSGSADNVVYFSFMPTESGEYVLYSDGMLKWNEPFFEGDKGYFSSNAPGIYNPNYLESLDEADTYTAVYNVIKLEAGEEFDFIINGDYNIKITKKDASKDYVSGYSNANAIELPLNTEKTFTDNVVGEKYYTFTADKDGRVYLDISSTDENAVYDYKVYHYVEEDESWYEYYNATNPFVNKDTAYIVKVQYLAKDALEPSYTLKAEIKELVASENTFTVKNSDGEAVKDVKITVNGVSGTTDENGVVKLTYIPGVYDIELDNLPSGYTALAPKTEWNSDDSATDAGAEYEITVYKIVTGKFVVKFGDKVLSGVTVIIKDQKNNEVAFADMTEGDNVTGTDGVTKVLTFTVADGYKVDLKGLSDLSADYRFTAIKLTDLIIDDNGIINLIVTEPPQYTLTLTGLTDWSDITVSIYRSSWQGKIYVLNNLAVSDNGVVSFKLDDAQYRIEINGLPTGYSYDEYACMNKTQRELTLKIKGDDSGNTGVAGSALATGNNTVSGADYESANVYTFTSVNGGKYSITSTYNDSLVGLGEEFDEKTLIINCGLAFVNTFTLSEGESISFWVSTCWNGSAEYTLTITEITE